MTGDRPALATAGVASWSWMVPALLFLAAMASVAFRVGTTRFGAGSETVAVARDLAEHGQFGNPYSSWATGPTAHVPPLYPAFLALVLRFFGYSAAFSLAVCFCSLAMHGLHAVLLPRISEIFFADRRPGIYAAILSAALPLFFFFPQYEVIYHATALMLFCIASYHLTVKSGFWPGLATGVLFGAVALLNPASISVTGAWVVYACWRYLKQRRPAFLLCMGLGAVAVLAPWTWRNYRQFETLFFVRDNLGLELYVSNNDFAQGSYKQNSASGLYAARHPDQSLSEAKEVARLGEIEYNHERMAMAKAWMRSHPSRFLALAAIHARMFWFPDAEGYPMYAFGIALATVGGALGFLLLVQRREPIVLFIGAVQLLYPILYYTVENDPRFRAPILWVSLLGAGYLLMNLRSIIGTRGVMGKITGWIRRKMTWDEIYQGRGA